MQYEIQFIKHDYAGAVIEQRAMDGYINATAMCKAAEKLWGNYWQNKTTQEFAEELSADIGIPISEIIQSVRGGLAQGTWVHPQVAIHLAQWLSPKFAVQVSKWVYDWMSGGAGPQQRVTPVFVQRYHMNTHRVESGYFSVIGELFIRFYGRLEAVGYLLKDRGVGGQEIRPDVSVGRLFADWLRVNRPEKAGDFKMCFHQIPNNNVIEARQYKLHVLPDFIEYMEAEWIPKRAPTYLADRDPDAVPFLQKLLILLCHKLAFPVAARTSLKRSAQSSRDDDAQGGDGGWDVPLRAQRERRAVGNLWVAQALRGARFEVEPRGESRPAPGPGSRRQRCTTWHGGESPASRGLRNDPTRVPA